MRWAMRGLDGLLTEQWDLTTYEEDEQCNGRPQHLLSELDLPFWLRYLWHEATEWLDEFEEFD